MQRRGSSRRSERGFAADFHDVTISNSFLARTAPMNVPSNSIGSLWTVTMARLRHAGTYFEVIECLRNVCDILEEIDRNDRLRFCKADYEGAIKILKRQKLLWSQEMCKESAAIMLKYFDTNPFKVLPTVLAQEIFLWLPISDFSNLFSVCSEWNQLGASNEVWYFLYHQKFLLNNPLSMPVGIKNCYMPSFQQRLKDPHIGDKVEVAWRGKFRLETQDVYQGLAWWVAEVVDKNRSQDRYKIHYPGWESRWDEWVTRARLRWMVATNTLVTIQVSDIVELWCCGLNVPGAWLECKVKKVRNGRYCLGRVLSSGYLWVDRDRLRLVRKGTDPRHGSQRGGSDLISSDSNRSRLSFLSVSSLTDRVRSVAASASRHASGCTIC